MANLGNLPEEVMIEILLRVPPESLVRFKCVAKSWYALINDPKFAGSLQNQNVLLKRIVTNKETGKDELKFSFLKYPLAADDVDVEDAHFPGLGEQFLHSFIYIHGQSHGLVCLVVNRGPCDIFLYNPATRQLRKLPPSVLLIPECFIPESYNPFEDVDSMPDCVGFGYDPKSRDFKVVRVVYFVEPPSNILPCRAEVYDLEKDEWREIETSLVLKHANWAPGCEMYHQGFYYWWAGDLRAPIIRSFDMSEEVFGQIPMPESFGQAYLNDRSMGVLNGSIVLLDYPSVRNGDVDEHERCFDVWQMVKLEGVVSWSKLFTIGPVFGIQAPLTFVGSDELLMETNEGQLIMYNMNTQHFKRLPVEGHPGESQAAVFIKTLLSINANGGHKRLTDRYLESHG